MFVFILEEREERKILICGHKLSRAKGKETNKEKHEFDCSTNTET